MGAYDDGGMTKAKAAAEQAANKKLLAQAEALLAKQKATLAALEKQQADAAAQKKADADAARAEKLAGMKAAREADLAAKSAARADARQAEKEAKNANTSTLRTSSVVGSSGGGSYVAPTPTPTPATPATVSPAVVAAVVAPPVKTAPIDTVLFNDDQVPIEVMSDLIFEDIGGHELINIARNDIINGQDISYQPIKNLTSVQQQYNPNNILSVQSTSDKYFSNFAIKLENKVPNVGNGPFGSNVYLDTANGSLVVEAINLEADEQIEVEITLSGTIYEADLTGSES
jgi:hypothetical protein